VSLDGDIAVSTFPGSDANLEDSRDSDPGSGVACAFLGATVSRYWWSGVAASLVTLALIMIRVN
jgi:hypothetical protein